jgi:hypothetical protein
MKQFIRRFKTAINTLIITGFMFAPMIMAPVVAQAQGTNPLCCGASGDITCTTTQTTGHASCNPDAGGSINTIISFVLNLFSIIVGIAAVIMIVVGGLKYTISGGDSTRVSGAKDTILFAVVGLVVVALAQVIVHFVLHSFQTANVGNGNGS